MRANEIPIAATVRVRSLSDSHPWKNDSGRVGWVFDHWPSRTDGEYMVAFGRGDHDFGYFARHELERTGGES